MSTKFLHARQFLKEMDDVVVHFETSCNIMLLDDSNFAAFRTRRACEYYGGFYEKSPAQVIVPSQGFWTIVVMAANGIDEIKHNINVQRRINKTGTVHVSAIPTSNPLEPAPATGPAGEPQPADEAAQSSKSPEIGPVDMLVPPETEVEAIAEVAVPVPAGAEEVR